VPTLQNNEGQQNLHTNKFKLQNNKQIIKFYKALKLKIPHTKNKLYYKKLLKIYIKKNY